MKRIWSTLIVALTILVMYCGTARAWGKIGHATIAQVAENHLTPAAKNALYRYLNGIPIAAIASDADVYRGEWTLDLGFIPRNPNDARVSFVESFDFTTPLNISPFSHSVSVDKNFDCYPTDNLDGSYINNAAYYVHNLSEELKANATSMDPHERYKAIALIVHLVGDMHCPMHIIYMPKNTVKGHYNVFWREKKYSMHKVWDTRIFEAYYNWGFVDMAHLVDTASPESIAEITEGNIYDYAGKSAKDCWPVVNEYVSGDSLPESYATDKRDILFSQLRNGGYRLATIFNYIFQ